VEPSTATTNDASVDHSVAAVLDRLDKRLARIEESLGQAKAMADQAPNAVAMAVDTFDTLCERAADAGIDVDSRTKNLLIALEKLTSPSALRVLQDLLDRVDIVEGLLASGLLDPGPVAIVSRAGAALAFTGRESPPSVGAWGALRALKDADIQRALGFALRFAQHFGHALGEDANRPALAAKND